MDISSLLHGRGGGRAQAEIEREAKRATDSRDAADNISTVDGAAVPCIGSGMGGFDENSVSSTVIGSDGDGFIEEAMEVFDTDSFVVAASGNMDIDIQNGADGLEETFEGTAVVDNDETAEADFQ